MVLVFKYSLLVALLATLSAGLPSPVEENEDKPSYVIHNSNVYINCTFYQNSPECKNNNGPSTSDELTDTSDADFVDNIYIGDTTEGDNSVPNPDSSPADSSEVDDTDDVPQTIDEATTPTNLYKSMEKYGSFWMWKLSRRDIDCSMCLAIMFEEEAIIEDLDLVQQRLPQFQELFTTNIVNEFADILNQIVNKKDELEMKLDEVVPANNRQEFCSSIVRQYFLRRARNALEVLPVGRRDSMFERAIEFHSEFIQNLEDDSRFMQCESSSSSEELIRFTREIINPT